MKKISLLLILEAYLAVSSLLVAVLYIYWNTNLDLLTLKDIPIYIVFLLSFILFFRNYKTKLVFAFLPFMLIIALSYFQSVASTLAKMGSIRQLLTPFLLLFLGYIYVRKENDLFRLFSFSVFLLTLVVFFGYYERFSYLWTNFNIRPFFAAKSIGVFSNGYPFLFIEPIRSIQERIGMPGIVRMVSTFLDPINLGHSLVLGFVLLYYEKSLRLNKTIKKWLLILFLVAILLTISKGAYLQLALVLFILNDAVRLRYRIALCILAIPILLWFANWHPGVAIHVSGLYSAIVSIRPLGYGLGMVGNYAKMFANATRLNIGISDSYFGSVIGQIGIVGFLAWLFPFYFILKRFPKNHYLTRMLIAQILVSSISENAFNVLSVCFLMIVVGGYYSILPQNNSLEETVEYAPNE